MFCDDDRQYNCTLEDRCKFSVNIRAVVRGYEVLCRQQLYNSNDAHHHGRRLSESMTTTTRKPMATASAMTPKPAPRNLLLNRTINGAKDLNKKLSDKGLPTSGGLAKIERNLVDDRDSEMSSHNNLMNCNYLPKQSLGQTKNQSIAGNITGKSQQREQQLQAQPPHSEETIDSENSSDDDTEDSVDAKNRKAKVSLQKRFSFKELGI